MGFWQTLREWSPLFIPLFGIIITGMGFWMRAELFRKMVDFQREYIKPLAEKLDKEMELLGNKLENQGHAQSLAVQELRGVTTFLKATIDSIKATADKLDSGSIQAAVTIGKHEEQIATLFRRVERNEDRLLGVERNTERRRDAT